MAKAVMGKWSARLRPALAKLGMLTTIGMFVVVAMGDLVTNAGAANGCGRSWPLCHGQLVPTFTPQTFIEFSHRAVVGLVSVGVLLLAVGILFALPRRREAFILAPALVFFLLLQAVLGGMAVLWPQSPPILALHLGFSLISFATVFLATDLLIEGPAGDRRRAAAAPRRFRLLCWLSLLYLYALIYLGAFVRHSNAQLACTGWPLCNGAIIPTLHGLVVVNLLHRLAALGAVFLFFVLWLAGRAGRAERPDLTWGSLAAFVALLAQAGSGAFVALSGMALWSAILHGALITIVFGALSYLCLHVTPPGLSAGSDPAVGRSGGRAPAAGAPASLNRTA